MRRRSGAAIAVATVLAVALIAAPAATPVSGPAGTHSSATVGCSSGSPTFTMSAPTMVAHDSTTGHDWQYVAWRPNVWTWNGSSWVLVAKGVWLWSWAYDDSPATYWYDFNGNYVGATTSASGTPVVETFSVGANQQYYLVSDEFYWYSNSSTAEAYDHLWNDSYAGDAATSGFCYR